METDLAMIPPVGYYHFQSIFQIVTIPGCKPSSKKPQFSYVRITKYHRIISGDIRQWSSHFSPDLNWAEKSSTNLGLLALEQLAWAENLRVPWMYSADFARFKAQLMG